MRKAQPVFAFVLLAVLQCICSQSGGQSPSPVTPQNSKVGTINLVDAQVETGPLDDLRFLEGQQDFHNGEGVRVTGGGKGELALDDGTQLLLFNGTQISGVNVTVSPNETRLRLEEQGFDGYVPPGEPEFVVMPNGAEIHILGTRFVVLYNTVTQVATAGNFDGTVLFTPPGQAEQPLPAGRLVNIPAQGEVTLLDLPFTPEQFEEAVDQAGTPTAALEQFLKVASPNPVTPDVTVTILPPTPLVRSGWEELGGEFTGAPAVASWAPGRLDVFVRGLDNSLWHRSFAASAWSNWENLGGTLTSSPGAVSWGENRIDVFAVLEDSQVWQYYWDGQWYGWYPQGGIASEGEIPPVPQGAPAVASWAPNRLILFVVRSDLIVIRKFWDGSSWSAWQNWGNSFSSSQSVVCPDFERVDAVIRGEDERAYWWSSSETDGPVSLDQVIQDDPAIASWSPTHLDVFARRKDDSLLHTSWDGLSWSPWESLGGPIYSSPAAVSWGPGRIDVFARGSAGQLIHYWYEE